VRRSYDQEEVARAAVSAALTSGFEGCGTTQFRWLQEEKNSGERGNGSGNDPFIGGEVRWGHVEWTQPGQQLDGARGRRQSQAGRWCGGSGV
jgi:hypothetical protein